MINPCVLFTISFCLEAVLPCPSYLVASSMAAVSTSEDHGGRVKKYYIPKCPLEHECSAASWGRVRRCASWTSADECKEFLRGHLKNSYLHSQNDMHVINGVVDMVEVVEEMLPAHWFGNDDGDNEMTHHRPPKRLRAIELTSATMPGAMVDQIAKAAAEVVMKSSAEALAKANAELSLQHRPVGKARGACPSSSSRGSDEIMTISRRDLVKAVAAVDRARSATEHAMKVAAGAEAAFRCEAETLTQLSGELANYL